MSALILNIVHLVVRLFTIHPNLFLKPVVYCFKYKQITLTLGFIEIAHDPPVNNNLPYRQLHTVTCFCWVYFNQVNEVSAGFKKGGVFTF